MTLTSQQNIPDKPRTNDPWTVRCLFSFGTVTTLAKVFVNPFDILLGYLVFVLGIAELFGRNVSWFFWALTVLILAADIFKRYTGIPSDTKKIKNEKK